MSNHNYTKYSNKKNETPVEVEEVKMELNEEVIEPIVESVEAEPVVESIAPEETVTLVEETVETVTMPEIIHGVVSNCTKLNVRVAPIINAEVACMLDAKTEVEINMAESTDEWFKVCTPAGAEGYCMRKFVDASL